MALPRLATTALLTTLLAVGVIAAPAKAAPPGTGPGGPILVVANPGDPFSRYYAEILQAEGLNAFDVTNLGDLTPETMAAHRVIILAQTSMSDAQVAALSAWVRAGGDLIAMRPEPKLEALLGLGPDGGDLTDAYIKVDTGSAPGAGITGETMQFHGVADLHPRVSGTQTVAELYGDAASGAGLPAVTLRSVGDDGGHAAAFLYDLARSVVTTRQGNPAWAGDKRDGQIPPRRSDDLFFGAKAGDLRPDWVDLDKVRIPQADEQQRLLANLITATSRDHLPLPRFWYLPRGEKAAVVLTGDDHGNGGTRGQLNRYLAQSARGCSVEQWECIRSTSYVYPTTPLTDAEVKAWQDAGFEIGLHLTTGCLDHTLASLRANWADQLAAWRASFPSVTGPVSNRTHCVAWSDWASEPRAERERGVRLDTNYYYWPGAWLRNRPGLFTGSGFPQRFADTDGTLIDVYQAATQITDESGMDIPLHIKTLIDNATGPDGFYGVFTTNMHTDTNDHPGADAIVAEATARGVPVISAAQLLTWLDGRSDSSFSGLSFSGNRLTFSLHRGAGAVGLRAMVPVDVPGGSLTGLSRDGAAIPMSRLTVKGVRYAMFDAQAGAYTAVYGTEAPRGEAGSTLAPSPQSPPVAPAGTPNTAPLVGETGARARDTRAPRLAIAPRTLRMSPRGTVRLRIKCPAGEVRCRIALRLRWDGRTVSSRTLSVRGGRTATVSLRLQRTARLRLLHRGVLRAAVRATATDVSGNAGTTTVRVTLRAPPA